MRHDDLRPLVAITTGAALLRFWSLGGQSFWSDEIATISLLRLPFSDMIRTLPTNETAPPLYYVLAWLWSQLVGTSEFAIRSLSALAGTLVVPVTYVGARVLVTRRIAIVAASLAASSPLLVWYSQEARIYALATLFSALTFLAFALAWRAPERRLVVLWAAAACLAVATSYFASYLVLGEAALLLLRHGRTRRLIVATLLVVAVVALLAPLAAFQGKQGNTRWIHAIPLSIRVEESIRQFATPAPLPPWAGAGTASRTTGALWLVGAGVLAGTLAAALVLGDRRERRGAVLAVVLGGATVAPPLLTSAIGPLLFDGTVDTFLYRALLPAWVPFAVVVATGLGARRARPTGAALAAALVVASVALTLAISTRPLLQRDDWRAVAATLKGDGVVLLYPGRERRGLVHYRSDLQALPTRGARTDEVELVSRVWDRGFETVRLPGPFVLVDDRRVQRWRVRRYRSPRSVLLTASTLPRGDERSGFAIFGPA